VVVLVELVVESNADVEAGGDVVATTVSGATVEVAAGAAVELVDADEPPLLQAANMTALAPITINRFTSAPITTRPQGYVTRGLR
jgi:hypothetical protein